MKSAVTRIGVLAALAARNRLFTLTVAALAFCALGCTSRKQYAINEAILISERRQLEDEIYRAKFELRDALRENEQLREQLEKENPSAAKKPPKRASASARRSANDNVYPGGDALRVNQPSVAPAYQDPDAYDNSPTRNSDRLGEFQRAPSYTQARPYAPSNTQNDALNARQAQVAAQPQNTQARPLTVAQAARNQNAEAAASQRVFGLQRPVQAANLAATAESGYVGQVSYEAPAETANNADAPGFNAGDGWSPVGM